MGKLIGLSISLLATAILTRKLGTSGYGQYALIISLVDLLVAIGNWGTQIIGVRELSRAKNKEIVFGSLVKLRLFLGITAACLGLAIVIIFPVFADIKLLALLSMPLVFGLIAELTSEIVFQTFVRMDLKAIINIIGSVIFLVTTIFLLNLRLGLSAPIIGWLFTKTIIVLLSSILVGKFIKGEIKSKRSIIRKLIKESLPMGTLLVLFSAYDRAIDSFTIKSFLGPTQVGIYGLAYKIYANLALPAYFLNNTIFPMLSKNPQKEFAKLMKIGLVLTGLGLLILIPLVFILNKPIILLIAGENFTRSALILKILVIALIFSCLNHLTGFSLVALNRQAVSLKIGAAALVWNLVFNLVFIPRQGIVAAAWVTVSTEALVAILSSLALCRMKKTISQYTI